MASRSDLTLLVPSKNRPENINRLLGAVPGDVKVVIAYTADRWATARYPSYGLQRNVIAAEVPSNLPPGAVAATNYALFMCNTRFVGFLGDDHLPQTKGWADHVVSNLVELEKRNKLGMLYGDDGLMHSSLPTAVFMSAAIPNTLGWMAPPVLRHLYMDSFWMEMGKDLKILNYHPSLKITHLHPHADLGVKWDATYEEANIPHIARDKEFYELYKKWDYQKDLDKLRELM